MCCETIISWDFGIEEGTFRKHLIADRGRARDMVYYAILEDEWPGIKSRLEQLLERHENSGGSAGLEISM